MYQIAYNERTYTALAIQFAHECNQKIITILKSTSRHGNRCSISISSATYPSSKWVTENHDQFAGQRTDDQSHKDNFAITSLDSSRRNKPQTSQIFHIKRINKKVIFLKKIQEIPNINWMYIHVHTYYTSTFKTLTLTCLFN